MKFEMEAAVDGTVDGMVITDNTVRIEMGEGRTRVVLNGLDITGMIQPGWSLTHTGAGEMESLLTVTFPVRHSSSFVRPPIEGGEAGA